MKKLLYVLGIVLVLSSCTNIEYKKTDDGRNVQIIDVTDVTKIRNIRYVEFDEHEYIYYQEGHRGSMCHSPKCKCLNEYKK